MQTIDTNGGFVLVDFINAMADMATKLADRLDPLVK